MSWWRDSVEFAKRFEASGWNLQTLAVEHDVSRGTVTEWRRRHGIEYPADINPKGNHANRRARIEETPPPPLIPIEHEQVRLEGDWAVSSDWHAPMTRYEVLHRFLDDSQEAGLSRLIIAGDLTNQDALAGHEEKQTGAELEVEMEHLHYSVDIALDVFDEIQVTLGNHDRHAAQKLSVSFDKSIRMLLAGLSPEKLARIKVTALDNVIVDTDEGPWLVCHTRSYSRIALSYPMKLAVRHGMHVAGGHRHHHAIGIAPNGYTAVDLGGLMDESRMSYANRYTNDMPIMANGYGLLIDGKMRCPMLTG
jgi:predicted phosphodiesterase